MVDLLSRTRVELKHQKHWGTQLPEYLLICLVEPEKGELDQLFIDSMNQSFLQSNQSGIETQPGEQRR
jgi:hypothetical protein